MFKKSTNGRLFGCLQLNYRLMLLLAFILFGTVCNNNYSQAQGTIIQTDPVMQLKQDLPRSQTFKDFIDNINSVGKLFLKNVNDSSFFTNDALRTKLCTELQAVAINDTNKLIKTLNTCLYNSKFVVESMFKLKYLVQKLKLEYPQLISLPQSQVQEILTFSIIQLSKTNITSSNSILQRTTNNLDVIVPVSCDDCEELRRNAQGDCNIAYFRVVTGASVILAGAVLLCAGVPPCVAAAYGVYLGVIITEMNILKNCNANVESASYPCFEKFKCPLFTVYADLDGDGFGDPNNVAHVYRIPYNYSGSHNDCNDHDATVYPGAPGPCKDCLHTLGCPPVSINLTLECEVGYTNLTWETIDPFISYSIERSTTGISWQVIGGVKATIDFSSPSKYSFKDANSDSKSNFYRVVAYQLSGSTYYSAIIGTSCKSEPNISIWPNPVSNITVISIPSYEVATVKLTLSNSQGTTVFTQPSNLHIGKNEFQIDVSKYPKGVYTLTVYNGSKIKVSKIIKL